MPAHKKIALITGATSGFGRELVKLFAQDHYAYLSNFVPDYLLAASMAKMMEEKS